MDMYKRVAMWRLGITPYDLEVKQLSSATLLGKSVIGSDETSKEIERQIQNLQGKERERVERLTALVKNEAMIAKRDGISKREHERYQAELRAIAAKQAQKTQEGEPQSKAHTFHRPSQIKLKSELERYEDLILRCEQEVEIRERRLKVERESILRAQKEINEADKRVVELLRRLQEENETRNAAKAAKFEASMKKIRGLKRDEELLGIQTMKEQYEHLEKKALLSRQFFAARARSAAARATAHAGTSIGNDTTQTQRLNIQRPEKHPGLAEKVLEHQQKMDKFKYKPVQTINYEKQAERLQKASEYIKNWKPPQKQESRSTAAIQVMMDYEMRMDKLRQIQDEKKANKRQWKIQVQQHQEKIESDIINKQNESFKQMQQFYQAKAANYEALKEQRERNRINLERQTAARNEFLEGLRQQRELKREQLDQRDYQLAKMMNKRDYMRQQTAQWINKVEAASNPEMRKQIVQQARAALQKM